MVIIGHLDSIKVVLKCKPAMLAYALNPCNQQLLLRYFFGGDSQKMSETIEFFAYISNTLGIYDIVDLEREYVNEKQKNICIENSIWANIWKQYPDVVFFFLLPTSTQQNLINKYNKKCVDYYNDIIASYTNL